MKSERLLVCRTAWMREYCGDVAGDPPYAGGKYIEENVVGGEVLNFKRHGDHYYGYVQASRGGSGSGYGHLDLTKHFGVPPDADSVDGVEAVWFAAAPDGTGQKVVGIYHNTTVLREARDTSPSRHVVFRREKALIPYNVIAKPRDVRFIPVDLRRFLVPGPGTPGAPGQSNASYVDADDEATGTFRRKLLGYIAARFDDVVSEDDNFKKLVVAGGQGTNLTAEERAAVEHRAVEAAIRHFTAPTKYGGWSQHGDYHPTGPFDLVFRAKGPALEG